MPASRQARLASDKAATRRHRQALESSIAENHHIRAKLRRQAAVVAEAIGVRAVTPPIMTLLSTSYGFTHVPAPSEL